MLLRNSGKFTATSGSSPETKEVQERNNYIVILNVCYIHMEISTPPVL